MGIVCKICGQEFEKQLTNSHLKHKHGMTTTEYLGEFPGAELTSNELKRQHSERIKRANQSRKGVKRTQEVKDKIRETKSQKEYTAWNKGKKGIYSRETIQKMSESKKGKESPNKGKSFEDIYGLERSSEIKSKIKEKRKNQENSPENNPSITRKAVETSKESNQRRRVKNNYLLKEKLENLGYSLLNDCDRFDMRLEPIVVSCDRCKTRIERNAASHHHKYMCPSCDFDSGKTSQQEKEIVEFLEKIIGRDKIVRNTYSVISPQEIDIWIPDYNLGIEHCGLFWHSEKNGNTRWYHKNKLRRCNEQGFDLVQIFEDEWVFKKNIVEERLKHKLGLTDSKIGARKCEVKVIEKKAAEDFLNNHHIQGYFGCYTRYGLFHGEELVSVMTFSKPNRAKGKHKNTEGIWEISRFASSKNVIGGASKLFKRFIADYEPNEVFSYADLRWGDGKLYENLGMKKVSDGFPNYWYVSGLKRIHRFSLRKKANEDQTQTEKQLRNEQGYNVIWDCGHAKWVWEK